MQVAIGHSKAPRSKDDAPKERISTKPSGSAKRKAAADLQRNGKQQKQAPKGSADSKGQKAGTAVVNARAERYQAAIDHDLAFQNELAKKLKTKRVRSPLLAPEALACCMLAAHPIPDSSLP